MTDIKLKLQSCSPLQLNQACSRSCHAPQEENRDGLILENIQTPLCRINQTTKKKLQSLAYETMVKSACYCKYCNIFSTQTKGLCCKINPITFLHKDSETIMVDMHKNIYDYLKVNRGEIVISYELPCIWQFI